MFLLICSLVLVGNTQSVKAQTDTPIPPTPTSTFQPFYRTPTAGASGDYGCPGHQPIGWLTVTPDPAWLLKCSQCITPVSSYDWGPTVVWGDNPLMTSTPIGIDTPTITPTSSYSSVYTVKYRDPTNIMHSNIIPDTVYDIIEPPQGKNDTIPSAFFHQVTVNTNYQLTYLYHWTGSHTGGTDTFDNYYIDNTLNFSLSSEGTTQYTVIDDLGNVLRDCGQNTSSPNCDPLILGGGPNHGNWSWEYDLYIQVTVINGRNAYFVSEKDGFLSGLVSEASTIEYRNGLVFPITQPTPTPTQFTDCSTVQDINGEIGSMGDDNFGLPYFSYGVSKCLSIGGWTVPLNWMEVVSGVTISDLTIPEVMFCATPISFGTLNMFGISIDLDALSFLMACVLMFRMLRT